MGNLFSTKVQPAPTTGQENLRSTSDTDNKSGDSAKPNVTSQAATTQLSDTRSSRQGSTNHIGDIFCGARMTEANHIGDITINVNNKENVIQRVSGLCMIPGQTLAVVDMYNISLVPATLLGPVSREKFLNLSPSIHDITQLNSKTVVLTSPDEEKLYYVSIRTLKLVNTVKCKGQCRGVTGINDDIVVTYDKPVKVEIRSMKGKLKRTIVPEEKGKDLFTSPWYVAVNPDQTIIYISDVGRDTITSLSLTGDVLENYHDTILKGPRGLAVDRTGRVYVCGFNSDNILQLAPDLKQPLNLIERSDSKPWSVCYSKPEDKLYIGNQSQSVKVYQLK